MTRRIAFINEKGGVGKTTLAVNVAAYFALKRKLKVLLLDLDTQGHSGKVLGLDVRGLSPSMFHLLTRDEVPLDAVTRSTPIEGLWVVPASKEMAEFPVAAATLPNRDRRLAARLEGEAERYDVLVFDAPPSLGLVTTNVLLAAREVVIPVGVTYLGLDGCAEMVETVEQVARKFGHAELRVTQVVPTLYRRTQLADEVVARLRANFPRRVAEPMHLNVVIDEAQSHGKTIWEYAPWSRGATILQSAAEAIDRAGRPLG
jgi:chromosome partitioning protein